MCSELTWNAGDQFERPQYSHSPQCSQIKVSPHSGQDPAHTTTAQAHDKLHFHRQQLFVKHTRARKHVLHGAFKTSVHWEILYEANETTVLTVFELCELQVILYQCVTIRTPQYKLVLCR